MGIYDKAQYDIWPPINRLTPPFTKVVVGELPPNVWFPFKEGDVLIYMGEISNMPGHVIVVDKRGATHWAYHFQEFRVIPKEHA